MLLLGDCTGSHGDAIQAVIIATMVKLLWIPCVFLFVLFFMKGYGWGWLANWRWSVAPSGGGRCRVFGDIRNGPRCLISFNWRSCSGASVGPVTNKKGHHTDAPHLGYHSKPLASLHLAKSWKWATLHSTTLHFNYISNIWQLHNIQLFDMDHFY